MIPTILDEYGIEQSWEWLVDNFGLLILHPANPQKPAYKIIQIRVSSPGPAAIIVTVLDAAGLPIPDLPVAWYWPDAEDDPNCGPENGTPPEMRPMVCDLPVGRTNGEGIIGHPMGSGAWYQAPERGPHATWIYGAPTNSDLLLGLGMIDHTAHSHLDLVFQYIEEAPEPEPEPEPCPWEQIGSYLDAIIDIVGAIRDLQSDQNPGPKE